MAVELWLLAVSTECPSVINVVEICGHWYP